MKLSIRRDAIEKLLAAFKATLAELGRESSDRERAMIRWFEEFLSDDVSPVDRVTRCVGKLKPGWDRPLSHLEMHELHGSLDTLATFTDAEWATCRDWLNYKPKSWENLFQVQNRSSFLRAPVDTLNAAEAWQHARKASEPRQRPANGKHDGKADYDVSEAREIFTDFLKKHVDESTAR